MSKATDRCAAYTVSALPLSFQTPEDSDAKQARKAETAAWLVEGCVYFLSSGAASQPSFPSHTLGWAYSQADKAVQQDTQVETQATRQPGGSLGQPGAAWGSQGQSGAAGRSDAARKPVNKGSRCSHRPKQQPGSRCEKAVGWTPQASQAQAMMVEKHLILLYPRVKVI